MKKQLVFNIAKLIIIVISFNEFIL